MANPTSTNALQTPQFNSAGVPTAGFGRINSAELGANPREGHIVFRLQF
jgi:hypothetical protein